MIFYKTIYVSSLSLDDGCAYCGSNATTWDHIIQRAKRGRDTIENLVPCCRKCNSIKGDRPLDDFLNKIGNPNLRLPSPRTISVDVYRERSARMLSRGKKETFFYGWSKYTSRDSSVSIDTFDDVRKRVFSGAKKSNGAPNWESSLY